MVREALTLEGGFALDTINVRIDKMYVFKDNRYKPIKVVAKMSGLINSFARTCLPKQNPAQAGMAPRAYKVKWKNDPWKEPALFYIGPVINGAVETMLPGLFVANKTKNNQYT